MLGNQQTQIKSKRSQNKIHKKCRQHFG